MDTENVLPPSEQDEDQKRTVAFLNEYKELIKKHSIDFVAYPQYVPNKDKPGLWETQIIFAPMDIQAKNKKEAPLLS